MQIEFFDTYPYTRLQPFDVERDIHATLTASEFVTESDKPR